MTATAEAAATPQSRKHHFSRYAAYPLVLLAIVVPFLRFHDYSLLLPESLILIGGAIAAGLLLAALSGIRRSVSPMLMAVTISIYLFYLKDVTDFLILTSKVVAEFTGNPVAVLTAFGVALFLLIAAACILLQRHLDAIVAVTFGTIVITTIALPATTGGAPLQLGTIPSDRKDLPPVVHIILDEHIGLAGLPDDIPESAAAAASMRSTFGDFALYSHAYSRFAETKFSLTSLLNRDLGAGVAEMIGGDAYATIPQRNEWFDALKRQGYAIKVYQSAWFDMCGGFAAVDACHTVSFFSPNPIQRTSLSTAQRLQVLAVKLFTGSDIYQLEPMVSLEMLARFRTDIAAAPRGVAYIVHLLIPHHGYLYSKDCALRGPAEWGKADFGSDQSYGAREREALYRRYLNQLICADRQIEGLFAELKRLGIYDEATIIVHGDHGSRIGERPFITDTPAILTEQDRIDHFSTLLAIKAAGVSPGLRSEAVALQSVFAKTFLGGTSVQSPIGNEVFVHTVQDNFEPIEFAWPDDSAPVAGRPLAEDGSDTRRRGG